MHNLGHTRSVQHRNHSVQTPDTFVRVPLPCIEGGLAIVHASRSGGAGFTQYTAELETGGTLSGTASQRFVYLLRGSAEVVERGREDTINHTVRAGGYAYFPEGSTATLTARAPARIAVIEKQYEPFPGLPSPRSFFGHEDEVLAVPLMDDPDLEVRALLPDSPAYDFAVNIMTYQPGAALSMVEVHVMEHGLVMLAGGGIYRLGDEWYPVTAGDFIWMAPYCPQWFGAIGKQPAKYLIYKDFNRHP